MKFNEIEGEGETTSTAAFMEESGGNNDGGDSAANESRQLSDVELIQEHCIELFSMRDYVMEPQVITTLLAFFQAGGQPERVIELLSGNYQGLGQYANLLGCWLADLELDDRTVGPSGATTEMELPSTSITNPPILLMGTDVQRKIESCPIVRNCFEQNVSQMIEKHFSPDAADKIFETEDGSTESIDWLPELISHRPWRRLIYDLAEHFPNCLMLNFAVKLISDAGFQREISNVNTAAQQLDIFSRVFLSSLEQLLDEWAISSGDTQTEAYQRTFAELSRVACHSEQTFLYTQMLLNHVGWKESSKKATICSSLAQQLRQSFDGNKEDIAAMHFGIIQSCIGQIPGQCIQAMLTMLSKGLNPADITQLYKAYSDLNSPPPPVVLIRDPFFMEMLIDALFNAINGARRIHEEHRPKYIYLLAYGSSVVEIKEGKGRKQNRSELESTREQIQKLVSILYSNEDLILSLDALLRLVRLPILAISILHFMRTLLLREDLLTEPSQLHFALIDQCAQLHPMLHPRIFKLLCALYDHQSGRNEVAEIVMERQRHVVDRFVHLLHSGMPIPVLERVVSMFKAGQIDVSLVRYFGLEVLDMVEPPYSPQFVAAFLPIVANREVFDVATFEKHPSAKEFLLHCNVAGGGGRRGAGNKQN